MDVVETPTRRTAAGEPSARALLLTILGVHVVPEGGEAWTSTLVGALESLGIDERAARQALLRTAGDGWLTGERVRRTTRWTVTPAARALLQRAWDRFGRTVVEDPPPWDGRWLLVVASSPGRDRRARQRLADRLGFEGFGSLGSGIWVSADAGAEPGARAALAEAGPGIEGLCFVGEVAGQPAAVVARAWDLDAAAAAYERFLARLPGAGAARSPATAFAARTRLVHEWRQTLSIDPALPPALLPARWVGRAARQRFLAAYERLTPGAEKYYTQLIDAAAV